MCRPATPEPPVKTMHLPLGIGDAISNGIVLESDEGIRLGKDRTFVAPQQKLPRSRNPCFCPHIPGLDKLFGSSLLIFSPYKTDSAHGTLITQGAVCTFESWISAG